MPRSPSDATRFTATGPYASSLPPNAAPSTFSPSQISFGAPVPGNETPQQKIARLRAAAAAAKRGKEGQMDQVVRVGRRWADRAHRITAISLIGLTAVSAAVAVAGISDMIIHNRRRRNEWLAQQQAQTAKELAQAKASQAAGMELNDDQLLLLNRERAAVQAGESRRNRPGLLQRTTGWIFGGASSETKQHDAATPSKSTLGVEKDMDDRRALSTPTSPTESVGQNGPVSKPRLDQSLRPAGGPLDRQAQFAIDTLAARSSNWFSQFTGK